MDEMKIMQAVCYNCFHYIPKDSACPYCGYGPHQDKDEYRIALKPGTPLANRYMVDCVLNQGGFGVIYVVLDSQIQSCVAIKGHLPMKLASRDAGDDEAGQKAPTSEKSAAELIGTIDTLPPTLYNRTVKVGFGMVHGKEKEYL